MAFNFIIIPIAFLLIMMYLTYFAYKRNQIKKYGLVFWMLFWVASIFVISFHTYFNPILGALNFSRTFDLYTIIGFMVVLFILFYLFRAIQRIESKIEKLTRELALKPLKRK
jgi:hypothetical protein